MIRIHLATWGIAAALILGGCKGTMECKTAEKSGGIVSVSKENPRYLAYEDGSPYIPIGLNLCFPRPYFYDGTEDEAFKKIEYQMAELSKNGGNYVRVWVSSDFTNPELAAGVYDKSRLVRFDRYMQLAKKYNLKVKLCMETFRRIEPAREIKDYRSMVDNMFRKPIYVPYFKDMREYLETEKGRALYIKYVSAFADKYAGSPDVFGIELWNEMNGVSAPRETILAWNKNMLPRVKKIFPKNMVMQSLGSMDRESNVKNYVDFMNIDANEIAQVHRYLDMGAALGVCRGPADVLASDAVSTILSMTHDKPVILAETGAVEPKHSGPFKLYEKDVQGVILHDVLFAAFYSGAAGAGQCWHWEYYVMKNNLYRHFGRFARAVDGINPIAERFEPKRADTSTLRVYALDGRNTLMLWARDAKSDWKTELEKGEVPAKLSGEKIDLSKIMSGRKIAAVEIYDPWADRVSSAKVENGTVSLPDFSRSICAKIIFKKE